MLKIAVYLIFFIVFYVPLYNSPSPSIINFTDIDTMIHIVLVSFIRIIFSLLIIAPHHLDYFKIRFLLIVPLITLSLLSIAYGVSYLLSHFYPIHEIQYYYDKKSIMLIIMLIIGYDEELFFRTIPFHLIKKYRYQAILLANILFSSAHTSQGLYSIILSAILGAVLCIIYVKYKNIHINALSHGLYNFLVLILN